MGITQVTQNTAPLSIPELEPLLPYLMYKVQMAGKPAYELSPAEMLAEQPTWNADMMTRGLQRLTALASDNDLLVDVYDDADCDDDPEKAEVKLIRMPADDPDPAKPAVVLVSGGAYTCVCSLVESIPMAEQLNRMGYDCYVFNYRCGRTGLMPLPLDDLAAALRKVLAERAEAGASAEYLVAGFSAGGNLTAVWGTECAGWARYGLPAPKALLLAYPFVSYAAMPEGPEKDWFCGLAVGGTSPEATEPYDVALNLTDAYPPCYITAAEDDPVVPVEHSRLLKRLLDERGIPAQLELIATGGHGWGDGTGTDAEGWPEHAVAFVENL